MIKRLSVLWNLFRTLWRIAPELEGYADDDCFSLTYRDIVLLVDANQIRIFSRRYWVNDHRCVFTNTFKSKPYPTLSDVNRVIESNSCPIIESPPGLTELSKTTSKLKAPNAEILKLPNTFTTKSAERQNASALPISTWPLFSGSSTPWSTSICSSAESASDICKV